MKNLTKELAENEHRKSVEEHNKEMAVTEKKQLKYQKLSFVMSMLSCLFTAGMLAVVIIVAMTILPKVDSIYSSTMVSLNNMEQLTDELNRADLAGTVNNINELTLQATGDLSQTMNKLNAIDLDNLNNAIKNLNDTVEPMAKFFGALR
ncbi:MAG: hypothetical protein IK115_10545 [Lachnospiraceae bacterium]|nr:hypothetical protein [Lachnospiraceae bacterium]